jgi:hypothetical protein
MKASRFELNIGFDSGFLRRSPCLLLCSYSPEISCMTGGPRDRLPIESSLRLSKASSSISFRASNLLPLHHPTHPTVPIYCNGLPRMILILLDSRPFLPRPQPTPPRIRAAESLSQIFAQELRPDFRPSPLSSDIYLSPCWSVRRSSPEMRSRSTDVRPLLLFSLSPSPCSSSSTASPPADGLSSLPDGGQRGHHGLAQPVASLGWVSCLSSFATYVLPRLSITSRSAAECCFHTYSHRPSERLGRLSERISAVVSSSARSFGPGKRSRHLPLDR